MFHGPLHGGSRGAHLPGGFDLYLRGHGDDAERLIHHHEAQHVLLTDTTAWGAALVLASQVPRWAQLFNQLLELCRTTHESFATYMSCSVVAASSGSPEAALAAYPDYVSLVDRLDRHLAPPDRRMVAQVLRQARLWLTTEPRPARLITFGQDVEPEEVVRVVDATTRVTGHPNVALGARLPIRLLAGYAFPESDRVRLAGLDGPLLAIRTLADDGTDHDTDAVWHVRLSDPEDVAELTTAWGRRRGRDVLRGRELSLRRAVAHTVAACPPGHGARDLAHRRPRGVPAR